MRYLLIDDNVPANPALQKMLKNPENEMLQVGPSEQSGINMFLSSGMIEAVFIRAELWDYRLLKYAFRIGLVPWPVLLGSADQPPLQCCGISLPEFLD